MEEGEGGGREREMEGEGGKREEGRVGGEEREAASSEELIDFDFLGAGWRCCGFKCLGGRAGTLLFF